MRVAGWFSAFVIFPPCLFSVAPLNAQENAAAATEVVRYLPEESIGTVTLWPARTAKLPRFRLAPLEVVTAAGLEQVGFDPLGILRVDVMLAMPGPMGPQFGAVVQMDAPVQLNALNPQVFADEKAQEEKGFQYRVFAGPGNPEIVLHQAGPKTVLVGTKIFLKRMVAERRGPTSLSTTLTAANGGQDALVLLSVKAIRPVIDGGLESLSDQLPPPVASDLATLSQSTDFMALRLTLDESGKLQWLVSANDDAAAGELEKSLANLLAFAREMLVQQALQTTPDDGSQTSAATRKYIERIGGELTSIMTPKRNGKRLVLEVQGIESTASIGTLVGLLLPAVQAARDAARRMDSSNNLKQLGLALHNYHDTYSHFPATAILEPETGKPLLSWRVAVLPYIEESGLYQEFHLDEPWDSEHNLKLLERMPATYQHKGRELALGHTVYVAPVNEATLLRKEEQTRIRDITDGTSNTIMLVEASEEAAVPWTKPEDLDLDPANPLNKLGSAKAPGIFQALFGDGSVRAISLSLDLETLNALFTRAGGEVVNF